MEKRSFKKLLIMVLLMAVFSTIFAGCTWKAEDTGSNEPKVLRILGGHGEEEHVRREWTDYYELTHPNVEFEIIPMYEPYRPTGPEGPGTEEEKPEDPMDRVKRLMTEGTPPDVILINDLTMLTTLVEDGLLQPLDTLIEKAKFDIDDIVPAVRDGIKDAGDGNSLYALAPTFQSQALFYNKDLFDQFAVPYPMDNMTWTQVADLARQFPSDGEGADRIHGLWGRETANIHHFLYSFAAPLGLTLFDESGKEMTVNTPQWESTLSRYIDLFSDGTISSPPRHDGEPGKEYDWEQERFYWEAFHLGKAAMGIMQSYEMREINNRRMYDTEAPHFDWDVVTVPVQEEAPGIGGNIGMSGLMAINRNAQNTDLAWDFIAFANGEEMLKIKSRNSWEFVSKKSLIDNRGEEGPANMAAFYTLKPAKNTMNFNFNNNNENIWQVFSICDQQFQELLKGNITVQKALDEMQLKGQEILDKQPQGNKE
jgi:multiple sugar transport system substrate-binding protein